MPRTELGIFGKTPVFPAVVAIFAWPGYQALTTCGRTWGIARSDSSNRFAGDHKRPHAGASLPNTQPHRPIGGWSHTVSGAAFWHSVPDELACADITYNSLILPVLLRISPRLWFSLAQPVFLQENLPVRCHKVDENGTTRTKYWAVPETTSAGTTVAD